MERVFPAADACLRAPRRPMAPSTPASARRLPGRIAHAMRPPPERTSRRVRFWRAVYSNELVRAVGLRLLW